MKRSRFCKVFAVLGAIFSSALSSCSNGSFHISLFVYTNNDTFMASLSSQIQNVLSKEYDLRVYNGESSQTLQNDQIVSELNDEENKFMIINLVDRLSAKTIIEKAKLDETPIIFINREPLERDLVNNDLVYYVGSKYESEGILQGDIANKFFGSYQNFLENFDKNKNKKVDVILVKGEQTHQDTENRTKYSVERLEELGYQVNTLDTRYCDWNRESARTYIAEIYEDYQNDIDLIFSNNDDMALGIIDYLKTLDTYKSNLPLYEEFFPIIGVDATEVGQESVMNDEMYGTVRNDFETQADIIYKLVDFIINERDLSKFPYVMDGPNSFHTDGIATTKENLLSL